MASIQQRRRASGDVVHRVMFRIDGRLTSETFGDLKAAQQFAKLVDRIGGQAAREIRSARTDSRSNTPTLAEWFTHYLEHATGITPGTRREYERLALRTWLPDLGQLPVDAVSEDDVRRWVGRQSATLTRRGTPTSAKTISNAHGLLFHVMSRAVRAKHRPDNPCDDIDLPAGTREEMVFLSQDEFARLLEKIPEPYQPFILTLAGTGMRWGEATALRWCDIDLDADVPVVRIARAWKRSANGGRELGAPKTSRSRRTISLPAEVVDALRPLRSEPHELAFTGARGAQIHNQNFRPRVWAPAVKAANLGKSPRIHDLRHTHASWLIAAGVPLPVIQQRLGHESIQTTVDVYGHLSGDALTVAARAASAALAGIAPARPLAALEA